MNEQYIDTIHRFLNGSMAPDEREAFEAELQHNPDLQQDVEFERTLLAGLEYAGGADIRQTIRTVHQTLRAEGFFKRNADADAINDTAYPLKYTMMKRIIAIAAAFVVLAGGLWFFMNRNKPVDPGALFAQYYQPQADVTRAHQIIATMEVYGMAGVQTETDSLQMALQLYEAGKYEEALGLLKGFLEIHPENDTAQYYAGVIHMSQGRYARALEILLPISRSAESALKNDALWNVGLCYLKMENSVSDARDAFAALAADSDYANHRGAKAVLEQLIPK